MANYNFRKDLPVAKKTEKEVASLLESNYQAEILDFEDSGDYDILARVRGREATFEVKEDFMCETTGNVSLEFECRGKPSGISTSKADYYIYKIHTQDGIIFSLHKTDVLRDMVNEKRYFRVVNGGDKGSNSMNYLFKYNTFVSTGIFLHDTISH